MTRLHRVRAITLEDKLAHWISYRINVLFRCGPGVGIASGVKSAFDSAVLCYRTFSAFRGEFEQALSDDSVEAILIDGLDRMPKKFRLALLNMLGERPNRKVIWAAITVLDEEDFGLDTAKVEGFDITVDIRTGTGN